MEDSASRIEGSIAILKNLLWRVLNTMVGVLRSDVQLGVGGAIKSPPNGGIDVL